MILFIVRVKSRTYTCKQLSRLYFEQEFLHSHDTWSDGYFCEFSLCAQGAITETLPGFGVIGGGIRAASSRECVSGTTIWGAAASTVVGKLEATGARTPKRDADFAR